MRGELDSRRLVHHNLLLQGAPPAQIREASTALAAVHSAQLLASRTGGSDDPHRAHAGGVCAHTVADVESDVVRTRNICVHPAHRHSPFGKLVLDSIRGAGENVGGEIAVLRVRGRGPAVAHLSNCDTSTIAGPLSLSSGATFGGGGSSSSAMPGHSPPEVQEPSGQGSSSDTLGSVDAHGFTTTTRRRTTSAAFPALSDTPYVTMYGVSAGVAAAVLTVATPNAETLSVRSPSTSSHAETPACTQVPCICTVSIMIITPVGVTASWPLPFRVMTGGAVSTGGTYSCTAGASCSASCEMHKQAPSSVHTAHALVDSTHKNDGCAHGLTTTTLLSTGVAELPAASLAEYVITYGESGSVGCVVSIFVTVEVFTGKAPSVSSAAVAPGSTYCCNCVTSMIASPASVMTGGVVSTTTGSSYSA
eukprot:1187812-Prorocentrum_minimum.AAC.6